MSLIYLIIALLIAITVHEAAHAWTAYILGDPTAKYEGRVSLNPFAHLDLMGTLMIFFAGFGWGKPVPYNPYNLKNYRWGSALIAVSGPLSNFLTAIIFAVPIKILASNMSLLATSLGSAVYSIFIAIIQLNIALMVFNLIPIAPLDGSKILAAFIPARYEYYFQEYLRHGPVILIGIIVFERMFNVGILSTVLFPLIEKVWAIVMLGS